MRRVRRIIFNGLTALSLLLCVATAGLWVRSYRCTDVVWRVGKDWDTWSVSSRWGAVTIGHREYNGLGIKVDYGWRGYCGPAHNAPPGLVRWHFCGFSGSGLAGSSAGSYPFTFKDEYISVPFWFLILLSTIPTLLHVGRARKLRHWRRVGRCMTCGYDLRATPERCPECGRVASVKT